jgi:hypothetical protein
LPEGWGCYSNGGISYPAFPSTLTPPATNFTVSCSVVPAIENMGTGVSNLKWTATAVGAGTNTTYTWYREPQGVGTYSGRIAYSNNTPGISVKSFVVATTIINGQTKRAESDACKIIAPTNVLTTTCTAKRINYTDPEGKYYNVQWVPKTTLGVNDTNFEWSGGVEGTGGTKYSFLKPGETTTSRVISNAIFPNQPNTRVTSSNINNSCVSPRILPIIAKCKAVIKNGTDPATGEPTNVNWTVKLTQGTVDITDNATFDWTMSSTTGGVSESVVLDSHSRVLNKKVTPGKEVRVDVKAKFAGRDYVVTDACNPITPPPIIQAFCTGTSPIPGYVTWNGTFNIEDNGQVYTEKDSKDLVKSVVWGTDNYEPFDDYDPLSSEPTTQDPLYIENNYDLSPLPPGQALVKNSMSITLILPDDEALASPNESLVRRVARAKKTKTVTKKVSCTPTYVPISTGSLSSKILSAAKWAADPTHPLNTCVPGTDGGNVACAYAVNKIVQLATGSPVDNSYATAQMINSLLRSRRFKLIGHEVPRAAGARKTPVNILDLALPGDIIISPSVGSGGNKRTGHVGIVETPKSTVIISNRSSTARVDRHWSGEEWRKHYVGEKRLHMYNFRPQ